MFKHGRHRHIGNKHSDARSKGTQASSPHHTTVPTKEDHMAVMTERSAGDTTIRPFTIETPEAELEDLRARIAATRFPEKEPVDDPSQGVQLATMQALARYWLTEYDWRKCEEKLKIIEPLTNPTAHGASAVDAFHLVIPSMPGYGFSGKPAVTGWGPEHIARAWAELMKRLGYDRYVASGGDWGGQIVDLMGAQAPPGLLGIHTNFPGAVRPDVAAGVQSGAAPPGLDDEETRIYENLTLFFATDAGYAIESATHPQALYGIADSPVGLAAWLIDHDATSMALISRVFVDGAQEGLTRDDVLDNITHYWLTNTGVSSARLYWEDRANFFDPTTWPTSNPRAIVDIPAAVSVFPDEIYAPPRSWAEEAYPKLIHYNKLDKGGHFAAWEQPQLFSEEVRAGFRSLR